MRFEHRLPRAAFCASTAVIMLAFAGTARASGPRCPVTYEKLKAALVKADSDDSTGFNNHFWGVVVNHEGVVCAVAFSGPGTGAQWAASRQIAAAKAFTAYGLSLDTGNPTGTSALSTAQLYKFVQPNNPNIGNPLFGLPGGNVLDSQAAYKGDFKLFGTTNDPMVGERVGGTITFGGGLGLYFKNFRGGGLGVSGDTACADHSVAWRARKLLDLEPPGLPDKLTFATDLADTNGHPHCPNDEGTRGVAP